MVAEYRVIKRMTQTEDTFITDQQEDVIFLHVCAKNVTAVLIHISTQEESRFLFCQQKPSPLHDIKNK
jgi:hypothetical protein